MKLYSYFRSSSAYRVRIALNLKGLDYEILPVNLVANEQRATDYLAANPQGLVPALVTTGGDLLSQSTAILEWLEDAYPQTTLYPADGLARARVRSLCQHIACEIQPVNNLRVLGYLRGELGLDEQVVRKWYAHWVTQGFEALEQAAPDQGFFADDAPGMFEVYLVPQVFNALRFEVDMTAYPRLSALNTRCNHLEPFIKAHPDHQ